MRSAREFAETRGGTVSFAIRTRRRLYGVGLRRRTVSASVVKAMLMIAYLNFPGVRSRPLRRVDRALLVPMVTRSDNITATRVRDIVGNRSLRRLAARVGMRDFATATIWGKTQITAADQTKLFLDIDRYVVRRHRRTALRLLGSIVPGQRWGIAADPPVGWALYFKGGWVPGTQNQVGLLRRGDRRVAIAVLVSNPHDYIHGRRTERGVAQRLLRGLRRDSVPY